MNIEDFLPKYPNVNKSDHGVLNPYDENFYEAIYKKKEFYENRLQSTEKFPREMGMMMKHQKTIARYFSGHTPYDRLLLVHEMGSGKTCSAIGAIEQIKSENGAIKGAIIIAKGKQILNNFVNELLHKCTAGQYIPENFEKLSDEKKARRIPKMIRDFYILKTIETFAKTIKKTTDADLEKQFSNRIIVIDEVHNLRIQPEKKRESLEIYQQYHRLLHVVTNCKIMMLSGTPMKDSPDEIASVMNLILPLDNQLPLGEEFLASYMDKTDDVYTVKPSMSKDLKNKFKGRVSFLRSMQSTVEKKYIGKKDVGTLKHLIVDPLKMSKFQSKYYAKGYKIDRDGSKKGIYTNSLDSTLFVYPDGSYGPEGYKKFISSKNRKKAFTVQSIGSKQQKVFKKKHSMTPELINKLKGSTVQETLNKVEKYSASYAAVLRKVITYQNDRCCFIYSKSVHGSGSILFSLILQLLGYSKASGKEGTKAPRYALITGDSMTPKEMQKVIDRFNSPDNIHGEYIQIIIGSYAVSEGFSFKHIQFEAILTPWFNYSETAQALARGIRLGSHNDLIKAGVKPIVEIMQPVSVPKAKYKVPSIDLFLYQLSEDKDISIRAILRVMMESAFDCALNYLRNHVNGTDGSRECDYTSCDYKCDGIGMAMIQEGLDNKDMDYSTYQLYYANPNIRQIHRRIEQLFRQNINTDLQSIINNLSKEFSEWEVKNALQSLVDFEEGEDLSYLGFLKVYSRSSVQKIIRDIELMFRTHFRLGLDTIMESFTEYTEFEIITALRTIINKSIVITNKYGFKCYLKEENNVYFLVDSLTASDSLFSEYYTKYPVVLMDKTYKQLVKEICVKLAPKLIKKLCKVKDRKQFAKIIKLIPPRVQEVFIESSLIAKNKNVNKNAFLRDLILEYFDAYIKKINDVWTSTLLSEGTVVDQCYEKLDVSRCYKEDEDEWKDCPEDFDNQIIQFEQEEEMKLREHSEHGIVGKINPRIEGAFCLIDLEKEKTAIKANKKGDDLRKKHTGKVCTRGWKVIELIAIAINRLKIDPPDSFKSTDTLEKLYVMAKKNAKLKNLFSEKDIDNMDRSELRRALFWTLPKSSGGRCQIKLICESITKWLTDRGEILKDQQCGVTVKNKKGKTTKKDALKKGLPKRAYRIERVVYANDKERFKGYAKDISKVMDYCLGVKRYRPEVNKDVWYLAFSGKLLAGLIVISEKGKMLHACMAQNFYNRPNIPAYTMGLLTAMAKVKTVEIKKRDVDYSKKVRKFTKFGFEIIKDGERHLTMMYKD